MGCVCFQLCLHKKEKTNMYVVVGYASFWIKLIRLKRKEKKNRLAINVQMTYILEITTDNHLHCTIEM